MCCTFECAHILFNHKTKKTHLKSFMRNFWMTKEGGLVIFWDIFWDAQLQEEQRSLGPLQRFMVALVTIRKVTVFLYHHLDWSLWELLAPSVTFVDLNGECRAQDLYCTVGELWLQWFDRRESLDPYSYGSWGSYWYIKKCLNPVFCCHSWWCV